MQTRHDHNIASVNAAITSVINAVSYDGDLFGVASNTVISGKIKDGICPNL